MGATACSCIQNTPTDEVQMEGNRRYSRITLQQQVDEVVEDKMVVTIEFKPLSETNPLLNLSLNLQSIARGFIERGNYSTSLSKKFLCNCLQTISKSYLAKNHINSLLESKHFGIYDYLPGTIESVVSINPPSSMLSKVKKVLKSEKLVEVPNSLVYQGEWDANSHLQDGFGIQTDEEGGVYYGYFSQGKRQGKGWLQMLDGSYYEGEFKNDEFDGKGSLKFADGRTISGKFVKGYLEGEGKEVWDNGTVYEGKFLKSKKHGSGYLVSPNNFTYKGEFSKDKFHGTGTLTTENQASYEGQWEKGKMHGKGTFTWPNGKVYVGDYISDKKHGKGRMKYPNKTIYNGDWVDDQQHGKAIYTFFDKKAGKMKSYNSYWENGNKVTYLKKDGTFFDASDSEA